MPDSQTTHRTALQPALGPASARPRRLTAPSLALIRLIVTVGIALALLFIWQLLARAYSPIILPGPGAVWTRFTTALGDGTYIPALGTTAEEAALGWLVGVVVAIPLGYFIGRFRTLEDTLAPYLAGSQAMPVVAIAPLLVVWVGFGLLPKIIVCALITFFPMLATTASGIRSVPRDLRDAARVFGANELALAWYVEFPLATRTILAGVKVAAALSVTGAVVGEFVSADQGLGYLITFGKESLDTSLMFVGLLSLIALGAMAYALISLLERILLRWDE